LEEMVRGGYNTGGEQSGHIILLDHNTTGDGLLTAVQLLRIMKETGKKLSELNSYMTVLPQVRRDVRVSPDKKTVCLEDEDVKAAIQQAEKELGSNGRVLVRPSGTEPVIRVMLEGDDEECLNTLAQNIADMIERVNGR